MAGMKIGRPFGTPLNPRLMPLARPERCIPERCIYVSSLGWDDVRLTSPVFEGDTIYSQSEVLETRESKSRLNVGIVTVRTTGYNQRGEVVITFKRTVMVYKHGHGPQIPALPTSGDANAP
jgi:itaconyl-CoA hydratase